MMTAQVPMPLQLSRVSLPIVSLRTQMLNQSLMFLERNFVFNGLVSVDNEMHPIRILRDAGASQSLLLEGLSLLSEKIHNNI